MTNPADKYYQVTLFGHPDEPIEIIAQQRTVSVTYERYLQREVTRWAESNNKECWLQENEEGLVALFSHREYQKPVEEELP